MESELSVRTSTVRPVKVSEMLRVLADVRDAMGVGPVRHGA